MEDSSGRRKTLPRLEWVLEHAYRVAGPDALLPLAPLRTSRFNDLHVTFAHHLAEEGRHITVNLDPCIENAARDEGLGDVRPLHLHGSIGSEAPEDLAVRSGQLGIGLDTDHQSKIRAALRETQLLAFVGYSGRDYFDVEPFFARWAETGDELNHLSVLWLQHHSCPPIELDWECERGLDGLPILRALSRLHADCHYVRGDTRAVLRELAAASDLVAPARRAHTSGSQDWSSEPRDSVRRWVTEGHLWWSMGHGAEVVALDRRLAASPEPSTVARLLLEPRWVGYRNVGLYDDSLALLSGVTRRFRRHSMAGSDQSLRGNRWTAGLLHARAVAEAPLVDDGTDDFHHAIDAVHGYVHWWTRERNTVLGRPVLALLYMLLRVARRAPAVAVPECVDPVRAYRVFADAERYFDGHPHAVNQLADVRRRWRRLGREELPPHVERRIAPGRDIFVETDHFLGYVNSERTELRNRLRREPPPYAEVVAHFERAEQIEDRPGMLKAALLLRALDRRAQLPYDAWRSIQWSRSRRLRWQLKWTMLGALRPRRSRVERVASSLLTQF